MIRATALAPAKVNLYLHVGLVREDGRHPLDSLVVFSGTEAADRLELDPLAPLALTVRGDDLEHVGPNTDNLVLRAAIALAAQAGLEPRGAFVLDKRLPIAAGIGGGSADAGAALRLLCAAADIDEAHARAVAPSLGGDVLASLHNRPCLMRGDGDLVSPVSGLARLPALLVNPGVACPTGPVFREFDRLGGGADFAETDLPDLIDASAAIDWLRDTTRNDLEAPACRLVPEIARLLDELARLDGAGLARMSGSGATCFALFESLDAAQAAARAMAAHNRALWIRATLLGEGA